MVTSADRIATHPATAGWTRPEPPIVDFVHVGVQKAGSSWLHQALSRHPDLFAASGGDDKDTCFFSYHYDRGYEWYERYFQDGIRARLRGEISTSYFPCREAPARIARYNPRMKILVCLRNPVERVISHHFHELRLGHISTRNGGLAEGLRNNPAYLEQSRYYTLLCRWLGSFPREQIHIVIFEHLFEEPARHLEAIYRFLGVDVSASGDYPDGKVNARRIPISRGMDTVTRRSSALLKALAPAAAVRALKRTGIHRAAFGAISRNEAREPIDDGLRQELHRYFRAENAALARLTGIDLDLWSA
jgi:Arc/MetJ family transcription regulator